MWRFTILSSETAAVKTNSTRAWFRSFIENFHHISCHGNVEIIFLLRDLNTYLVVVATKGETEIAHGDGKNDRSPPDEF